MRNRITVSNVERAHGPFSYIWPVQSRKQFFLVAPFYFGGLAVSACALYFLLPGQPFAFLLLCGAAGGLAPLFWNLPGTLVLRTGTAEARHFVADLTAELRRCGYADTVHESTGLRFVIPGPHWLHWPESQMIVRTAGNTIELRGPVLVLGRIKRFAERELGARNE